jgi:hypothetical protein
MFDALCDPGRGHWIGLAFGVTNSLQDRLRDELFSVGRETCQGQRCFWPHDMAVNFQFEWLEPVEVVRLGVVSLTVPPTVKISMENW